MPAPHNQAGMLISRVRTGTKHSWGLVYLQVNTAPKLVLLDVGMVAELTPEDQQNLVGFFKVCMLTALVPLKKPLASPHTHAKSVSQALCCLIA